MIVSPNHPGAQDRSGPAARARARARTGALFGALAARRPRRGGGPRSPSGRRPPRLSLSLSLNVPPQWSSAPAPQTPLPPDAGAQRLTRRVRASWFSLAPRGAGERSGLRAGGGRHARSRWPPSLPSPRPPLWAGRRRSTREARGACRLFSLLSTPEAGQLGPRRGPAGTPAERRGRTRLLRRGRRTRTPRAAPRAGEPHCQRARRRGRSSPPPAPAAAIAPPPPPARRHRNPPPPSFRPPAPASPELRARGSGARSPAAPASGRAGARSRSPRPRALGQPFPMRPRRGESVFQ
jgi:hypothetical protein